MKAKSDSRVQGCAGKPLNSRCATISYMEKSEKVVASNRTPKIEKTPFSLNWCKIYDFEPRRVCEDVRGRGRFIAEIDPTWTPDRVPIGRITPLCLFYNPHPLCSLWLNCADYTDSRLARPGDYPDYASSFPPAPSLPPASRRDA